MNKEQKINELLQPFQKFGISLGLDRIRHLLNNLGNPEKKVPILHVAGTNGKGSVCAYLSSILTQAGYKTGRYTSPHLVSWTERICLNEQPINYDDLIAILEKIKAKIDPNFESPTQFEVITAAAWLYFADLEVDVAVIEVGLGGRLDATNVCESSLASIITSISREHWQRLGDTLGKIAYEKAGIIKNQCPVIVGELPLEAEVVVKEKIENLECPSIWVKPAENILKNGENWANYQGIEYPLSLAGDIQQLNSALAIATIQTLQKKGWQISLSAIQEGMKKTRWRGRIEWIKWQNQKILIDGAHNVASAQVLREYVDTLDSKIIWIMGMLSTKDHSGIFKHLLRPNDQLFLVPVPDHSTAEPKELVNLAQEICPKLTKIYIKEDLFSALNLAIQQVDNQAETIVICGSLYLLGYFLSSFKNFETNT